MSSQADTTLCWRYQLKGRGEHDHHIKFPGAANADKGGSLDLGSTVVGQTLTLRIEINSDYGMSVWTVSPTGVKTCISKMKDATAILTWKENVASLGNQVLLRILSYVKAELDNVSIYTADKNDYRIPGLTGYQTTALTAETYSLRLIAKLDSLEAVAVGFRIGYRYEAADGTVMEGYKIVSDQFVYTSITADYGNTTLHAGNMDANYLVVLHITDIPTSVGEITYTVSSFATFEADDGTQTTEWAAAAQTFKVNPLS
jgi:hypothetical protein